MDTETIDKLFLELSQFTQATTKREIDLAAKLAQVKKERDRWEYLARIAEPEYLAMKARAEKAERERDEAREACVNSANAWLAAANHAEKAEQENARLREALAALLDCCMDTLASGRPVAHMDTAMEAARTALGGE